MMVAESLPLVSKFEKALGIGGTPKIAKSRALCKARSAGTPKRPSLGSIEKKEVKGSGSKIIIRSPAPLKSLALKN